MRPSAAHMEPGAGVTARDMRTRSARPARGPQNTGELLKATPPARAQMGGALRGGGALVGVVRCGRGSGVESGGSSRKRRPPGPADPRLRAGLPGFPL